MVNKRDIIPDVKQMSVRSGHGRERSAYFGAHDVCGTWSAK
jgi:hypothetical protein